METVIVDVKLRNLEKCVKVVRPFIDRSKTLTFVDDLDVVDFRCYASTLSPEVYPKFNEWLESKKIEKLREATNVKVIDELPPEEPPKASADLPNNNIPSKDSEVDSNSDSKCEDLTICADDSTKLYYYNADNVEWVSIKGRDIKVGMILTGSDAEGKPLVESEYYTAKLDAEDVGNDNIMISVEPVELDETTRKFNEHKRTYNARIKQLQNNS